MCEHLKVTGELQRYRCGSRRDGVSYPDLCQQRRQSLEDGAAVHLRVSGCSKFDAFDDS